MGDNENEESLLAAIAEYVTPHVTDAQLALAVAAYELVVRVNGRLDAGVDHLRTNFTRPKGT